ncbi:MAG: methyltransferase domain-containing protein [Candidatus Methanoperedenaceae archaeon]|nr:methyltransferase domain-containing protein [Candidatus Methanoperedenaceae archaeon]
MKKVNLGSGTTCLEDWINIESSFNAKLAKYPRLRYLLFKIGILPKKYYEIPWSEHIHKIMIHDVRKKLPFNDDSIDFIYSSHLIEHLRKDECEKMLGECFRILKKGGLIRLSTPDLELTARNYIKEIDDIQNDNGKSNYLPSENFLDILDINIEKSKTPFILKSFVSRHKWIYDRESLTALLKSCGFTEILKKSFKVGEMPNIEFLDNRPEHSLYIEARKPR